MPSPCRARIPFLTTKIPARPNRCACKLETRGDVERPITRGSVASCHVGRRHPPGCCPSSALSALSAEVAAPDSRYLKRWDRSWTLGEREIIVRGRPSQGQNLSLPFALHHIKRLARECPSLSMPCLRASVAGAIIVVVSLVRRGISADDRRSMACMQRMCVCQICFEAAADVLVLCRCLNKPGAAAAWHILGVY